MIRHIKKTLPLIAALLLMLTACRQSDAPVRQDNDYFTMLSDIIQNTSLSNPEDNLPFIDSLERIGNIPTPVADYYRANTYYAMQKQRVVEFYYKKALDDERLYDIWPKAYYISSRNLANNLRWKGDEEKALSYATKAYQKAIDNPTKDSRLNAPGLLMFIGLCQKDLGHTEESRRNLESSYQMSLEESRADTSFNAHYHFAVNILSILLSVNSETPKEEAEKWTERAKEAVAGLKPTNILDRELAKHTASMTAITVAKIKHQHGECEVADSMYNDFLESDYAKTPEGLGSKYRYLLSAGRWKEAVEIIPKIDSIRTSRDRMLTMESLKDLKEEYIVFKQAGMPDKAQERVDFLIENLDAITRHQQLSMANEMSFIFETQQKEQMIAEQKTEIAHQRVIAVSIVMLLITVFAAIFISYMHKVAKKTKHEHIRLQKAYKQLTIANEKAEESSRMKSSFIRQISHEIRTPLNILSGFSQIVTTDDYHLDKQSREEAKMMIQENTNRITELVNKMLDLSEAISSSGDEGATEVNVGIIVEHAVEKSRANQFQDIDFSVDYLPPTSPTLAITTKESKVMRALSSILDNACKFTKKGDVRLKVGCSDNGDMLVFTVEDTGIGVPANEAEHIFEEFVQLDEFVEGTGIGLTVARSFARSLGGDVVLDTSYSGGARFVMTLPKRDITSTT